MSREHSIVARVALAVGTAPDREAHRVIARAAVCPGFRGAAGENVIVAAFTPDGVVQAADRVDVSDVVSVTEIDLGAPIRTHHWSETAAARSCCERRAEV